LGEEEDKEIDKEGRTEEKCRWRGLIAGSHFGLSVSCGSRLGEGMIVSSNV